jgi:acyl carrier protein
LRKWLAARLPDYMIPSTWTQLAALPLNHNGKLDRSALPEPARDRATTSVAYVAPRDDLECDLAGIFADVLGIDRIGVRDDFFDLGGDSIAAVRLTSALQRLLDDAVMLVAVFNAPTIEALAVYLSQNHGSSVDIRYSDSHLTVPVVPETAMEQGEI